MWRARAKNVDLLATQELLGTWNDARMPSFSISNNALLPLKAILRNLYTLFIKACYVLDTSLNSPLAPILSKR